MVQLSVVDVDLEGGTNCYDSITIYDGCKFCCCYAVLCVCVCVRACERVCVRASVCMCVCVSWREGGLHTRGKVYIAATTFAPAK